MKGKQYKHEGPYNTAAMRFSPEAIRELLNESLKAVHHWKSEHDLQAAYIQDLEKEIRRLKSEIISHPEIIRLPIGGVVR